MKKSNSKRTWALAHAFFLFILQEKGIHSTTEELRKLHEKVADRAEPDLRDHAHADMENFFTELYASYVRYVLYRSPSISFPHPAWYHIVGHAALMVFFVDDPEFRPELKKLAEPFLASKYAEQVGLEYFQISSELRILLEQIMAPVPVLEGKEA